MRLLASDACHGCGQCVAACPSEALVSTEVNALMVDQAPGEPQRLGCHRSEAVAGDRHLHCLRTLGPDLLAWLAARAAPMAVTLYLPDGCRDCPAAPRGTRDDWRGEAGVFCEVIETGADADYRTARQVVSRRDLLRGRSAPQLPAIAADDAAPSARRLQRHLAAVDALETQTMLPTLTLNANACLAHGVCARVCPTAALQSTQEGALIFDPLACLDCGHCQSACPEQALDMSHSAFPVTTTTARVTLRQGQLFECFECQHTFPANGEADSDTPVCPACRRERALLEESFHDLFG